MFGIGGKKEDKLEENMEEIKDLINKGKSGREDEGTKADLKEELQQFDSEFSDDPGGEAENTGSSGTSFDSQQDNFDDGFDSQDTEGFDDTGAQENFDNPGDAGNAGNNDTETFDESFDDSPQDAQTDSFSNQQVQQNQQPAQPQSGSQEGQQQPQSRTQGQQPSTQPTKEQSQSAQPDGRQEAGSRTEELGEELNQEARQPPDIPQPAKTRELDVPEIEKGPLFIKRQKFESAQSMIQDMRYLSQEIEQVINRLEQGIEEDQRTERQARELLQTLEEDRQGVTSIINPEEKQ